MFCLNNPESLISVPKLSEVKSEYRVGAVSEGPSECKRDAGIRRETRNRSVANIVSVS